jgi:hypothetical protein
MMASTKIVLLNLRACGWTPQSSLGATDEQIGALLAQGLICAKPPFGISSRAP